MKKLLLPPLRRVFYDVEILYGGSKEDLKMPNRIKTMVMTYKEANNTFRLSSKLFPYYPVK